MFKLLSFLGAIALYVISAGQASALSVTDELNVFYTSSTSFNINNISLVESGTSLNLIDSIFQSFSVGPGNHQSLFTQTVNLDVGSTYTFSFDGTFQGNVSFQATAGNREFGLFVDQLEVRGGVSPVPLPASLPLFALALIGLAGFAYQAKRKRDESVAAVESSASVASALC